VGVAALPAETARRAHHELVTQGITRAATYSALGVTFELIALR
jgi:hypothetical protein